MSVSRSLSPERVLLQTGELVGPASVAADRTDSNPLPERPASRSACPPINETMGQVIPFPQRALTSQALTPEQAMKYEMNALSDDLPFIKELLEPDGQKIDYLFSQLASHCIRPPFGFIEANGIVFLLLLYRAIL